MPLVIDDQFLEKAGLSEREARIEIACRLYAAGKWDKKSAREFCGLDRIEFWMELGRRGIDPFGYTAEDLQSDLENLDRVLGKP